MEKKLRLKPFFCRCFCNYLQYINFSLKKLFTKKKRPLGSSSAMGEFKTNCSSFLINCSFSSSRCTEALRLFKPGSSQRCPILDMIEFLPETYKVVTGKEENVYNESVCTAVLIICHSFCSFLLLSLLSLCFSAFLNSTYWTAV